MQKNVLAEARRSVAKAAEATIAAELAFVGYARHEDDEEMRSVKALMFSIQSNIEDIGVALDEAQHIIDEQREALVLVGIIDSAIAGLRGGKNWSAR